MKIEGNDLRLAAATATQLQNTGADKKVAPKMLQQRYAVDSHTENSVQSLGSDKVSIRIELPRNTADTLQRMGNLSDVLNSVATSIRQSNEGLKATSQIVDDMKTSLDNITKSYPPYSVESQARIDQLMTYFALKKQMMSLMVPAPPVPVYEKVQHLWEDLFSGPNSTIQTPTLPLDVPDTHIKAAAKQLSSLSDQVGLLQEALGNSIKTG